MSITVFYFFTKINRLNKKTNTRELTRGRKFGSDKMDITFFKFLFLKLHVFLQIDIQQILRQRG